jgi:hypothetical protein
MCSACPELAEARSADATIGPAPGHRPQTVPGTTAPSCARFSCEVPPVSLWLGARSLSCPLRRVLRSPSPAWQLVRPRCLRASRMSKDALPQREDTSVSAAASRAPRAPLYASIRLFVNANDKRRRKPLVLHKLHLCLVPGTVKRCKSLARKELRGPHVPVSGGRPANGRFKAFWA